MGLLLLVGEEFVSLREDLESMDLARTRLFVAYLVSFLCLFCLPHPGKPPQGYTGLCSQGLDWCGFVVVGKGRRTRGEGPRLTHTLP
jgi:hypothetical protein